MTTIGVLALQGAVEEHLKAISHSGSRGVAVKYASQLDELDGLILPGGESTAIRRLMQQYDLFTPLKAFSQAGKGLFGTCAGLVLLATDIEGGDEGLGLINCSVQRNGFGRQKDSFEAELAIPVIGAPAFRAVFIRAPWIRRVGDKVEVLATFEDKIVAARSDNILVTAFHPELTGDHRLIEYFISQCLNGY